MSSIETKFSLGRDLSKKQKQHIRKYRQVKKDKKEYRPPSKDAQPLFLRSWFLKPLSIYPSKILQHLSNPYISFSDRYESLEDFDEQKSDLAEILEKATKSPKITKEDCKMAYEENQKLRWSFKKLVLAWRLKHLQCMNDTDIITLEEFKNPIVLIDFSTKKKYQFEAKSYMIDCVNRLLLHSDFFPGGQMPRDLLTNKILSWNQLWTVSLQFRKQGVSHWVWEAFVNRQFDIHDFIHYYDIPLKYEMVDRCFHDNCQRDVNWYTQELITNHTQGMITKTLQWALYRYPTHSYIKKWKDLCHKFWKIAVARGEQAAENSSLFNCELDKLMRDYKTLSELRKLYNRENPIIN